MNVPSGGAGGVALLVLLAAPAVADTQTEVGDFADASVQISYSSNNPPGLGQARITQPVTGIDKFDPGLGTLQSVTVNVSFEVDLDLGLTAQSDGETGGDGFDARFDIGPIGGLIEYQSQGLSTVEVLSSVDTTPSATCSGSDLDDDCSGGSSSIHLGGGPSVLSALASFNAADFVGTGEVTALTAVLAMPWSGTFTLEDVAEAEASFRAVMRAAELSVEYAFVAIPEPLGLCLTAAAGVCVATSRGRRDSIATLFFVNSDSERS